MKTYVPEDIGDENIGTGISKDKRDTNNNDVVK